MYLLVHSAVQDSTQPKPALDCAEESPRAAMSDPWGEQVKQWIANIWDSLRFLKGDQDGGGGIQAEKNFANGSGIYSENLKDWESWRVGSAFVDALDVAGCWSTGVGISCVEKGIVSGAVQFRAGQPVGSRFRETKMEGNSHNHHPKAVKVGKTDLPHGSPGSAALPVPAAGFWHCP